FPAQAGRSRFWSRFWSLSDHFGDQNPGPDGRSRFWSWFWSLSDHFGDQNPGRSRSGGLEGDVGVAEGDLVALGQLVGADPHAVDPGAVGRAEVDEDPAVALGADLVVVAADVGVRELHGRLGLAAEGHGLLAER